MDSTGQIIARKLRYFTGDDPSVDADVAALIDSELAPKDPPQEPAAAIADILWRESKATTKNHYLWENCYDRAKKMLAMPVSYEREPMAELARDAQKERGFCWACGKDAMTLNGRLYHKADTSCAAEWREKRILPAPPACGS